MSYIAYSTWRRNLSILQCLKGLKIEKGIIIIGPKKNVKKIKKCIILKKRINYIKL